MMLNRGTRTATVGAYETIPDHVSPRGPGSQERLKRGFDVALAIGIILTFLPLFAVILSAMVLQGRPFLIRHSRLGYGGRFFPCLKFRTMVVDGDAVLERHLAENAAARAEWDATRKIKDDPRVTGLGRVLRKSSLDELPQLINVLRGEMSLVGPRPIVAAEVKHYGSRIQLYEQVRPGMTGAWQVSGRSNTSYEHRVSLDCDYVLSRGFRRDLTILALTFPAVLSARGSC